MFDKIAFKYESTCHYLAFGVDLIWRKQFLKYFLKSENTTILDIATGTGEIVKDLLKYKPKKIIGIDISENMLNIAKKKCIKEIENNIVNFEIAEAENIPFDSSTFDIISIGYGIRNFENLEKSISEMHRVLKTGGKFYILELTVPKKSIRVLYQFYFKYILPLYAQLLTKNHSAYVYLNQSVIDFPQWNELLKFFQKQGFKNLSFKKLSFGIATIYLGEK